MMEYSFTKLNGLGNDFIVIEDWDAAITFTAEDIKKLCDRHFGIGADGVILVRPSAHNDCVAYMHYINSDGTLAQMCGNGIRCFAKFLVDYGYVDYQKGVLRADTLRGPLAITFDVDAHHYLLQACVDMDEPILAPALVPVNVDANALSPSGAAYAKEILLDSPWGTFRFTCVSMGNPHAVCFLENMEILNADAFSSEQRCLETFDVAKVGAFFEQHSLFPEKSNIEFVVAEHDALHMRVYERGCGETLACGTGACATLVAAVLTGRSQRKNTVSLLGGNLHIDWSDNNHVFMTGPAEKSFSGTFTL